MWRECNDDVRSKYCLMHLKFHFLKICSLVKNAELQRHGAGVELEREIFYPLVHTPNGHTGHDWPRLKLGPRKSRGLVSCGRGHRILDIMHCFPRCNNKKLDWK